MKRLMIGIWVTYCTTYASLQFYFTSVLAQLQGKLTKLHSLGERLSSVPQSPIANPRLVENFNRYLFTLKEGFFAR